MNTWLLTLQNSNSPTYNNLFSSFWNDFTMMILTFITLLFFFLLYSL